MVYMKTDNLHQESNPDALDYSPSMPPMPP